MGLFGRKREMNNAAAVSIPNGRRPVIQPGPTTIHNHGISWAGIIATGFACAVALLPVFWYVLVFLFDKMGANDPEAEAAFWVVIFPALFILGWLVKWLLLSFMDSWFGFQVDLEKEVTRREEIKLQSLNMTIKPGRMNEADREFARVILAVMDAAYTWLEQNGGRFPPRWRPWSMRSSLETAGRIGVRLSHDRANAISQWLYTKGVITSAEGGHITPAYPDLSSVSLLLDKEFGAPIEKVTPLLRSNQGFEHI